MHSAVLHFFDYMNAIILVYFLVTNVVYTVLMIFSLYTVSMHAKSAAHGAYADLLESPVTSRKTSQPAWLAALGDRIIRDPRELAVFAFIGKTLARSRQHRMVLTAFAALAVAVIFDSFASLALSRSFRGFSVRTPAPPNNPSRAR